jgi:hypothetical protein
MTGQRLVSTAVIAWLGCLTSARSNLGPLVPYSDSEIEDGP